MNAEIEMVGEVKKKGARKTFPSAQSKRKISLRSSSLSTQPQKLHFSKIASSPSGHSVRHRIPEISTESSATSLPLSSSDIVAKMRLTGTSGATSAGRPEKWFGTKTYSKSDLKKLMENQQPCTNNGEAALSASEDSRFNLEATPLLGIPKAKTEIASTEDISVKSKTQGTTDDTCSNLDANPQVGSPEVSSNISSAMPERGTAVKRPSDEDFSIPKKIVAASRKMLFGVATSLEEHIGSTAPRTMINEKRPMQLNDLKEKEKWNAPRVQVLSGASKQPLASTLGGQRVIIVKKKDLEKIKGKKCKIIFPKEREKSIFLQPTVDCSGKTAGGSSKLTNLLSPSNSESAHHPSTLNASEINNIGESPKSQCDLKEFASRLSMLSQNLQDVYEMIPDSKLNEDLGGELLILGVELMMSIQSIRSAEGAILHYLKTKSKAAY